MTKEQKLARAEEVQAFINETKEMVYKGELDPSLYFSRLAGIFCCEIMGFYDCQLNTDLDLEKIEQLAISNCKVLYDDNEVEEVINIGSLADYHD